MTLSGPFLVIFCRLYEYLSQKCSSDDHLEVSNISKSELAHSLKHEMPKE